MGAQGGVGWRRWAFVAFVATNCANAAQPHETRASLLAAFGERLFHDRSLSADRSVACADCHQPSRAFSDGLAVSTGAHGRAGVRNTPSLLDVAGRPAFGWDGGVATLAEQALRAFTDPLEMGLASADELVLRVEGDTTYRERLVRSLRADRIDAALIGDALAAFLRQLGSGVNRFDRFMAGETQALDPHEHAGYLLFVGAAGCSRCHSVNGDARNFTDDRYHRSSVGMAALAARLPELVKRLQADTPSDALPRANSRAELLALGRFAVSRQPADIGAYRTPGLRNVALTAPYFHDGSVSTLEEAVAHELYYHSAPGRANQGLTPAEVAQLTSFLRALTEESTAHAADSRFTPHRR